MFQTAPTHSHSSQKHAAGPKARHNVFVLFRDKRITDLDNLP